MKPNLTPLLSLLLLLSLGCKLQPVPDNSPAPTPPAVTTTDDTQQAIATIETMLTLATAGNWADFIDNYYGETHKFTSPSDREQLIQRFQDQWGETMISTLQAMRPTVPTIEGDVAIFTAPNPAPNTEPMVFKLYRTPEQDWKFHL